MTNKEADFRCQVAYEQLEKVFDSLGCAKRIDDMEKLGDIMRQLVIFSQIFNDEHGVQ